MSVDYVCQLSGDRGGRGGKGGCEDLDEVVRERDQAVEDLQSVDNAFADLHRRYEKLRGSISEFQKVGEGDLGFSRTVQFVRISERDFVILNCRYEYTLRVVYNIVRTVKIAT